MLHNLLGKWLSLGNGGQVVDSYFFMLWKVNHGKGER